MRHGLDRGRAAKHLAANEVACFCTATLAWNSTAVDKDVRRILGHRDIATTIAFYVGFEAAAAAERFDTVVLRERKATRVMARAAWGVRPPAANNSGKGR